MQFITNRDNILETHRLNHFRELKNSMARLNYVIFCETSLKDMATLKPSFVNLFNEISIPPFLEFLYQSFSVGVQVDNIPAGPNTSVVQIYDPDGDLFAEREISGELLAGNVNFEVRFDLLKFEKLGKYYVKVRHNGTRLGDGNRYFINVQRIEDGRRPNQSP